MPSSLEFTRECLKLWKVWEIAKASWVEEHGTEQGFREWFKKMVKAIGCY